MNKPILQGSRANFHSRLEHIETIVKMNKAVHMDMKRGSIQLLAE